MLLRTHFLVSIFLVVLTEAKVDPKIGVAGFSSGAFMAVQYQFAYSSSVVGAAIFAGGPYYCAQKNLVGSFAQCMQGLAPINLGTLEAAARQFEEDGKIDGLGNLTSHHVYLYSSALDVTVKPSVVKYLEQMYKDFKVSTINSQFSIVGAHTFPTTNYGNLCSVSLTPFISRCAYNGAQISLQTIFGKLKPAGTPIKSNIISLIQSSYTPGGASPKSLSLGNTAFAYIPNACKDKSNTCKLLLALHGCLQFYGVVSDAFISHSDFNSWAESNNIIVVYPQTIASIVSPVNAQGCWDWWGYCDANYATKQGKQLQFLKNLVDFFVKNY